MTNSVKKYLIHHIDADGFMSRYIMEKYMGGFEKIFRYNYEDSFATFWGNTENIEDNTTFVFVDVTPDISWLTSLFKNFKNCNVMIFDHHLICEELQQMFAEEPRFQLFYNSNIAACSICLSYIESEFSGINLTEKVPYLIYHVTSLIHFYDTWQFADKAFSEQQKKSVLSFMEYFNSMLIGNYDLFVRTIENYIELRGALHIGDLMIENKRKEAVDIVCNKLKLVTTDVYVSDNFEVHLIEGTPNYFIQEEFKLRATKNLLLIFFKINYLDNTVKFSCRSIHIKTDKHFEQKHTARYFSLRYGGGGHMHAAGFALGFKEGVNLLNKLATGKINFEHN